jgi:hypothetical protein
VFGGGGGLFNVKCIISSMNIFHVAFFWVYAREVYELQNKFIKSMFYFVMISSTMSMRELLFWYFFLVIHGFGTLWCPIDSCEFPWCPKGSLCTMTFQKTLKKIKSKAHK